MLLADVLLMNRTEWWKRLLFVAVGTCRVDV